MKIYIKRTLTWLLVAGIISGCVYLVLKRKTEQTAYFESEKTDPRPLVRTISPVIASDTINIVLPGSLQPYLSTSLYGRVNGYIGKWFSDIGTSVQQGQVLATIETPELDQQLQAARSAEELAKANLDRVLGVSLPGAVSQQDKDTRNAAYTSAQAARRQLEAQTAFKKITAPFSGIVTARNIDFGSLVNTGSSSGKELFRVEQVSKLRVFVEVPQAYSFLMKPGLEATLTFREFPGKKFKAELFRTSGTLNPDSRTLTTVFVVNNSENTLYSGMYTEVNIQVFRNQKPLTLAATGLYIQADKPYVMRLDSQNRVHVVPVVLGQDNGITVEVANGLIPGERLVNFPSDAISEGMEVRIAKPEPAEQTEKQKAGLNRQTPQGQSKGGAKHE